jgi:hypothetical protein
MFEQIKIDGCEEFLQVYQEFRESVAKLNAQEDPMERIRHAKLTVKVDKLWNNFSIDQKNELTELLIIKKILPAEVRKLLKAFGGQVVLT